MYFPGYYFASNGFPPCIRGLSSGRNAGPIDTTWAVTKLHGVVKVRVLCAQRRAGVFLNMKFGAIRVRID